SVGFSFFHRSCTAEKAATNAGSTSCAQSGFTLQIRRATSLARYFLTYSAHSFPPWPSQTPKICKNCGSWFFATLALICVSSISFLRPCRCETAETIYSSSTKSAKPLFEDSFFSEKLGNAVAFVFFCGLGSSDKTFRFAIGANLFKKSDL